MNKKATPWVDTDCCGGKKRTFDLELEKINLDYRVDNSFTDKYQHYVSYLKKFFHSDDPKVLVKRAWQSHVLPIFCDITNSIFLVDSFSGKEIRKVTAREVIASELEDVANLLAQI
jgi:hypothetical protein